MAVRVYSLAFLLFSAQIRLDLSFDGFFFSLQTNKIDQHGGSKNAHAAPNIKGVATHVEKFAHVDCSVINLCTHFLFCSVSNMISLDRFSSEYP